MRYDIIVINTTIIEQNRIQDMICHNITVIDIIEHNIYVTAVANYIDFMSFQSIVKIGRLYRLCIRFILL
jgi:hypothetical protein